jgi:hypothetical protein
MGFFMIPIGFARRRGKGTERLAVLDGRCGSWATRNRQYPVEKRPQRQRIEGRAGLSSLSAQGPL